VQFMSAEGCRHPYQIYAAISHLIMFFILLLIYKKQKSKGTVFWSFVSIYGIFRFITDFVRDEPVLFTVGSVPINTGQLLSLIMGIIGIIILIKKKLVILNSRSKYKAKHKLINFFVV
jgi:phosphatidylglycerol---prolipoprotein diacylglyceryl transferase